jgi:hypothetical protein
MRPGRSYCRPCPMAVVIRHADPTRSRGGVNLRGGIPPGGLFAREQPTTTELILALAPCDAWAITTPTLARVVQRTMGGVALAAEEVD